MAKPAFPHVLLVCTLTGMACHKHHNPSPNPYRTILPITIVYDAAHANAPTPIIRIKVGNSDTTVSVVFDTGSNGLRILKGAVANTGYQETGTADSAHYCTPPTIYRLAGTVCTATLTIGDLSTTTPINFMNIDAEEYDATQPWVSTADSTTIAKNNLRGINGIMGVGMRGAADNCVSPLAQLPGNAMYIIQFPTYGGTAGTILLNPSEQDTVGFTLFHLIQISPTFPNGLNGYQDFQLYGCFTVGGKTYWAYTVLDTGNPNMEILAANFPGNGTLEILPAGTDVTFGLADSLNGPLLVTTGFTSASPGTAGLDRLLTENNGPTPMNYPAIMPFFKYDVLYDQADGIIGLRTK